MTDAPAPAPAAGLATDATAIRARLVDTLRRDLIGPGPEDADLARELLKENPSRWYLTGFLAPSLELGGASEEVEDEGDPTVGDDEGADPETGPARAADDSPPDEPSRRPRRLPSSLGLTVLLDAGVEEIEVVLSWGDYATEPPLPEEVLTEQSDEYRQAVPRRCAGAACLVRRPSGFPCRTGAEIAFWCPGRAARSARRGALVIEAHARPYEIRQPDGSIARVRALTVMVVNRRPPVRRRFADVTLAFQVRLELRCASGFFPRHDLSGYGSADEDAALADLHYRDVAEYAVGRDISAGWRLEPDGIVRAAFTDHLPQAEVERVEPQKIDGVEFGMEALATLAHGDGAALVAALAELPSALRPLDRRPGRHNSRHRRTQAAEHGQAPDRGRAARGASDRRWHRAARVRSASAPRVRGDERGGRPRRAPAERRTRRRPERAGAPEVAAVPARLHPAEPARAGRRDPRRPRDRGPAVLPDRRRQDGGLSRPRRLDDRPPPSDQWRHARRRRRGADALHAPASDARPAVPRGRRHLRPRADARRAGVAGGRPHACSATGRSRSGCGSARPPRRTGSARPGTGATTPRSRGCGASGETAAKRRRRSRPARGAARRSAGTASPACRATRLRRTWRSAAPTPPALSQGPPAAGADRRRGDLPPAAGLPDRHRRQVRRPSLDRARPAPSSAMSTARTNGASTARPNPGAGGSSGTSRPSCRPT